MTTDRREGDVKMEAEIAVMQPQAKDTSIPQKMKEAWDKFSPRDVRGSVDFWPPELRETTPLLF